MSRHIYSLLFSMVWCLSGPLFGQVELKPGTQQPSAAFGYHLAQDGDWLLVGAKDDTLNNVAGGTAYFYKLIGDDWVEWQKVGPEIPSAGDMFGISVDIDGNYAVIGADGDDDVSVNSGAAYIYKLVEDQWQLRQKLLPQETGLGSSEMGIAVAMKNDILVVGAYSDITNGAFAGAAYIYSLEGDNWVLETKVLPGDGAADDKFGRSVHTDGNRVIICGVLNDDDGMNSGSVYIFTKSGGSWLETAKLLAPDAFENDRFGRSVAINRDYAAVGSVLDDDNGEQSGSVYIFKEYSDGWRFKNKITPSDGQADDFFGYALSFSNPYLLVSAHNDDDYGLNSGAVYLFKRVGDDWQEQQKIYANNPAAEANFGESIDINDNFIAIGAPYAVNETISTGAAYVLESPVITHLPGTENNTVRVYPNPTADLIYIEASSASSIKHLYLYNSTGQVLQAYTPLSNGFKLDLINYPSGVYQLQFSLATGTHEFYKIIKR